MPKIWEKEWWTADRFKPPKGGAKWLTPDVDFSQELFEQIPGYQYDPSAFADPFAAENRARLEAMLGGGGFRGGQQEQVARLQARARGEGPSLAEEQAREAGERNLAQAIAAQATAGGGVNPALAQRQIGRQRAEIGQDVARQEQLGRLREQQQAEAGLAGVLGQARGADIQTMGQLLGYDLDQMRALMELERLRGGEFGRRRDLTMEAALQRHGERGKMKRGAIGGIASLGGLLGGGF